LNSGGTRRQKQEGQKVIQKCKNSSKWNKNINPACPHSSCRNLTGKWRKLRHLLEGCWSCDVPGNSVPNPRNRKPLSTVSAVNDTPFPQENPSSHQKSQTQWVDRPRGRCAALLPPVSTETGGSFKMQLGTIIKKLLISTIGMPTKLGSCLSWCETSKPIHSPTRAGLSKRGCKKISTS
jgi:hypothetical protein